MGGRRRGRIRSEAENRLLRLSGEGLPRLAYFSGSQTTVVRIKGRVRELTIENADGKPLRLRSIIIKRLKKAKPEDVQVETSAPPREGGAGDPAPSPGHRYWWGGVRVGGGDRPFWRIRFKRPRPLKKIELKNILGGRGEAGYNLKVRYVDFQQRSREVGFISEPRFRQHLAGLKLLLQTCREAQTAEGAAFPERLSAFIEAFALLLAAVEDAITGTGTEFGDLRRLRRAAIGAGADLMGDPASLQGMHRLAAPAAMLDALLWRGSSPAYREARDAEAVLIVWAHRLGAKGSVRRTELRSDLPLLRGVAAEEIEARLAPIYLAMGGAPDTLPIQIRKHNISPAWLRFHRTAVIEKIDLLFGLLTELGYEGFVNYGTLLGMVREKDFIAHDDDVDLCFTARGGTAAEVRKELRELAAALKDKGLNVNLSARLLLHVKFRGLPVVFDLWPVYEGAPGVISLYMQRIRVGQAPKAAIYPLSSVPFFGRDFPAPADPEEMLRLRYGEGWRTPDRYFEQRKAAGKDAPTPETALDSGYDTAGDDDEYGLDDDEADDETLDVENERDGGED